MLVSPVMETKAARMERKI